MSAYSEPTPKCDAALARLAEESTMDHEIPSDLILKQGSHTAREYGMCAMEAVAWLAGEPHSDTPTCAPFRLAVGVLIEVAAMKEGDQ
jgi:hypothetical protein